MRTVIVISKNESTLEKFVRVRIMLALVHIKVYSGLIIYTILRVPVKIGKLRARFRLRIRAKKALTRVLILPTYGK